ncbi:hypothetical protein HDU96_008997 [Phlyctochytrium bullatum]|nr:hypothetical protein HDU96_008997 [Phlyctochytrium bullatum]
MNDPTTRSQRLPLLRSQRSEVFRNGSIHHPGAASVADGVVSPGTTSPLLVMPSPDASPTRTLSSATTNVVCELCGAGGHAMSECPQRGLAAKLLAMHEKDVGHDLSARQRSFSSRSMAPTVSKAAVVAIPWLLNNYGWVALAASWIISVPLAFYKWNLATNEESRESMRAFSELADNVIDTAVTSWNYMTSGSLIMASFYMANHAVDRIPFEQFSNFTNTREYFTFLTKSIVLGVYKNVSYAERDFFERRMGEVYFGANTTRSI